MRAEQRPGHRAAALEPGGCVRAPARARVWYSHRVRPPLPRAPAAPFVMTLASVVAATACGSQGSVGDPRPPGPAASLAAPASAEPEPPAADDGGALFLAVQGVGIVRLDGVTSTVVLSTKETLIDMAMAPSGALWASYYEVGTLRIRGGEAEKVSADPYDHFVFRGAGEVWATTASIGWEVARFDGTAWTKLRKREDFKGTYDDNKLNDLAVTSDAVWVSSWNGLFRFTGQAWEVVPGPKDHTSGRAPYRLIGRGRDLVAEYSDGFFAFRDGAWRPVSWPASGSIVAMNGKGAAAGQKSGARGVVLGAPLSGAPASAIPVVPGGDPNDMALDESGRVWIAGEDALTVLDPKGKVLATWEPGTLAGVTGAVRRIGVSGSGPAQLPAKQTAARWDLTGKVEVYKSATPLASAKIALCASPRSKACEGASFSRTATTKADGTFRLTDVPPGDFWIRIAVPDGTAGCDGLFRESPGATISIARECHVAEGAPRVCAVPTMHACMPFEMPPPH